MRASVQVPIDLGVVQAYQVPDRALLADINCHTILLIYMISKTVVGQKNDSNTMFLS